MIYVFLANGFEEIEALAPVDILRRAELEVKTVGIGGGSMVEVKDGKAVLKKVDAGNVNTLPDGAQFQIQRNGKWMKLDPNPNPTRRCRRAEGNRPARPNEPQTSPSPTNHRHPTGDGRTA